VSSAAGSDHRVIGWLTAQSVVFGALAALYGTVANALFLGAYGSRWLPVTYIAVGAAGIVVSSAVARLARAGRLHRIAVAVLGIAALVVAGSWVIGLVGGSAWVSPPLLVLFPILVQLGFVFIGAQAGRILDIGTIKGSFPRILAGFPVGAVVGGLAAGALASVLGRTEHLLLITALAAAAFAALVWLTERSEGGGGRVHRVGDGPLGGRTSAGGPSAGPPSVGPAAPRSEAGDTVRTVLARPFVLVLLAYQALSALGSQISDFLVYDRAAAAFSGADDLARFVAGYTAVMNAVSIAFLVLAAGPLLRRFGLRVGIAANPIVVGVFAAAMLATLAVSGGGSFLLLAVVSAARISDIALTDGTTRTSINALYLVLPERVRLTTQTTVEGIGVPIAIGLSGVLILVVDALPAPLPAMLLVLAIVCVGWALIAARLYGAYRPALVDALRAKPVLDPDAVLETGNDARLATQLVFGDARSARLGLDFADGVAAPALRSELGALAADPRAEIRLGALGALAAAGDAKARRSLAAAVRDAATGPEPAVRTRAAVMAAVLDARDRAAMLVLLADPETDVRLAALDSVQPGDTFALEPAVRALGDASSVVAATGAIGRLCDIAVPTLARILDAGETGPLARRIVRAVSSRSPIRDEVLARHAGHADRDLGRIIIERLAGPTPAVEAVRGTLEAVLLEDAAHAVRIVRARRSIGGDAAGAPPSSLLRALDEELDLVGARVSANVLARYGRDALGAALAQLAAGNGDRALPIEALTVTLTRAELQLVTALVDPARDAVSRHARLEAVDLGGSTPARARTVMPNRDVAAWLRDLVEDADAAWRSPWLRACAIRAAAAGGHLERFDLEPARALDDRTVDEEIDAAAAST
jgi:hypothetical protein